MVFIPKLDWQNSPSTATPITAAQLLRIENGIAWIQEVKPRTKTAEEWTTDNDILVADEIGLELDTLKSKVGDGVTAWNSLAYTSNPLEDLGGVDLSQYLKIMDAQTLFAEAGHTHASGVGGNLCPNGEFNESGANWDTTNKVGSPVVTYESSPLDTGLAAKMVFAAAGNEQVFLSDVMDIPGDDINGLSGSFVGHSTKRCTYSVELLTSSLSSMDPDYDAAPENLSISQVVALTTVANDDTPVTWSVVFRPDAVKARIAIRIKADAGQTLPITAYLDSVAYAWAAGAVSTTTPQAQGVVAKLASDQLNVPSGTPTKLLIDSVKVDRGGYFDAANHQLVVPSLCSGLHTFHAQIPFEINTTLFRRVVLKVNTVEVTSNEIRASATHPCVVPVHYVDDLKNGDVLELFVEHDSGVALDVLATGMNVSIVREDRQPQDDVGEPALPPVAGFTIDVNSGTVPKTVTATSTATGDISSRTYDFGEGPQASRIYTYQGAYSGLITQTVYGPGGSDQATLPVNFTAQPLGDVALVKSQRITAKPDGATSVVAALPTGVGAPPTTGDKIVLWAIQRGNTPVISNPAGYTSLGAQYVGSNAVARAWHKTAGASESAPTVASDLDAAMVVGVLIFTADSWKTTDPWSVDWIAEGVSAATQNYQQPSVTTQDNNALRVAIAGHIYAATTPTISIPEDFTGRGSQTNAVKSSNGLNIATRVATNVVPTAGSAGVAIWTSTVSAVWIGMQFAVTAKNATDPVDPGAERFPGDPKQGKIRTTWIQHGGSYAVWKDQLALIRGVAYPGGAADSSRNSGLFKIYDAGHPNPMSDHVAVVQDGRIPFITYNINKDNANAIMLGQWDARLNADIATLNSWKTLYNAVVWTNIAHEPETKNGFVTKADRRLLRECQRYYVNYMRSGGSHGSANAPTNWAFVGPVYMQGTLGDAVWDFNNGSIREDPWWEYDPNWRGPEAGPTGYTGYTGWSMSADKTKVIYKPVDFYTGDAKYYDIAGADLYCFHWQHGVGEANPAGWDAGNQNYDGWEMYDWSSNPNPANFVFDSGGHCLSFEGHSSFGRDQYLPAWDNGAQYGSGPTHGGDRYRDALDLIHGTGADRMPIFIAEWGFPIFQANNTADPDWSITFAHYQWMLQNLVDNDVVGLCMWKGDDPADVRQATIDGKTVSTALGTKGTQMNPIGGSGTQAERTSPDYPLYPFQAKYDPTDTRRKLFAWWQDSTLQKKALRR